MLTLFSTDRFNAVKKAYQEKDDLVIGTTGVGYMVTNITTGEILLATWRSYSFSDSEHGSEKMEQLFKMAYKKAVRIDEDMHIQTGMTNDGSLLLCGLKISQ